MMSNREKVWIIDDDRSIRWVLERALEKADIDVTAFENANGVLDALHGEEPDAIITDIRMPGMDGLGLLDRIHERFPELFATMVNGMNGHDENGGEHE